VTIISDIEPLNLSRLETITRNQLSELCKQGRRVVRTRRCFGVILHAKNRFCLVSQSFHCLVVQIDAVNGNVRWQRFGINGKSVILGCDLDFAGFQIFHGLIAATVSEFQLERFATERLAKDLVSKTNSKNWHARLDQITYGVNRISKCRRVTRTVGQKDPCRLVL